MSITAHQLKYNEYYYDQKDKVVYHILRKEDCHKNGHCIKLQVENFATCKHTNKTYSHDHHLVTVQPENKHYTLSHVVIDNESGKLFLKLFDNNMNPRDDLYLNDAFLVKQMLDMVEKLKPEDIPNIKVNVIKLDVPAMHRADSDLSWERIIMISNIDFSHLYDPRHGHHHIHH